VPGLVQGSLENAAQSTLASVGTDDRLLGADQHHRTLVKPDAFHVSVLFQPTLCFLERVSDILPPGSESMRSSDIILDDFVLKVYLPQLEEKVSGLFHQAVSSKYYDPTTCAMLIVSPGGADAFQPDPSSSRLSHRPLVKAGTQSMALVNSLCSMLQQTPFHQENYTRLILSVIIQFYQRCYDKFQALVMIGSGTEGVEPKLALAARWAQRPEMNACLLELLKTDVSRGVFTSIG
jgi:exocyst complex component 4